MTKLRAGAYVIGESPLVEEFVQQCTIHDVRVAIERNSRQTIPSHVSVGIELTNTDLSRKKKNLQKLDRSLNKNAVILSSSVTATATEQASWIRYPRRLIGFSALPTLLSQKLIEFAPSPSTGREYLLQAQEFFIRLGKEISVVQDRIGMVLPRILCMLINEAYFALQEGVATPEDIDVAMKLGTNYPSGLVEWGDRIGMRQVYAVLKTLQNDLAEDRYRIAPLLRQVSSISSDVIR